MTDFSSEWAEMREFWRERSQEQLARIERAEQKQWNAYVLAHSGKTYERTFEACQRWFGRKYRAWKRQRILSA